MEAKFTTGELLTIQSLVKREKAQFEKWLELENGFYSKRSEENKKYHRENIEKLDAILEKIS
jgi:Skp family chaperone for outer membrane proteins